MSSFYNNYFGFSTVATSSGIPVLHIRDHYVTALAPCNAVLQAKEDHEGLHSRAYPFCGCTCPAKAELSHANYCDDRKMVCAWGC